MRNLILLLSIAMCLVACTHMTENAQYEAKAIIPFGVTPADDSDLSFDIRYIQLETNDSCLLGVIGQIEAVPDSLLFILDSRNLSVFAFTQGGKFLSLVGNKGEGPGEYIQPYSFFVDDYRLGVIDLGRQKVIYYQLDDFSFQSEKQLPFDTRCCAIAKDGNILWNSVGYESTDVGDNYFILTDSAFNILVTTVEKRFKSGYIYGDMHNVYSYQGRTYGYTPFDASVWNIGKDSIAMDYQLQLGDLNTPPYSFLMENSNGGHAPYFGVLEESGYVSYYTFREFADYCSVFCIANNERYVGFYDKMARSSHLYALEQFEAVMKTGAVNYLASGSLGEYSVFPLETPILLDMKAEGYCFNEDMNQLLQNTTAEDNHILMCVKISSNRQE